MIDMRKKPLTNKAGEVREITFEEFLSMRQSKEVLPEDLNKQIAQCHIVDYPADELDQELKDFAMYNNDDLEDL